MANFIKAVWLHFSIFIKEMRAQKNLIRQLSYHDVLLLLLLSLFSYLPAQRVELKVPEHGHF